MSIMEKEPLTRSGVKDGLPSPPFSRSARLENDARGWRLHFMVMTEKQRLHSVCVIVEA